MNNRKKCVSSRDVAREAGVSQATVSYILNNVQGVSIKPETREAVFQAVKRLNYHPNQIARGMKLNRSMSIGVVTDRNVTNFYFMKTLEGIRDGFQQKNYSLTLLFNKSDDVAESEFIRYYNSNRIDGIVFAFASINDETISYMKENGIPFVLVDAGLGGRNENEVCTDHVSRISNVITHFINKGANRIGYAGPVPGCRPDRRVDAFKHALVDQGLECDENLIVLSTFDDEQMQSAIFKLLQCENRPDAILAGSPKFGMLTLKSAARLGIAVPKKLSIIAVGSSNYYNLLDPSLSALELPLSDMGNRAALMLLDIMDGREIEGPVVLPSELVIRDSS